MNNLIDVSSWSQDYNDHRHPFFWGIMLLITIEVTVVLGFAASYFYLWLSAVGRGVEDWSILHEKASLFLPSINLVLLFLCAGSMYYGGLVMDRNEKMKFFWSVVFCCVVASILLVLRWLHLTSLPFSWQDGGYAAFLWTATGFHFLHVTSALIGTAVIGLFAYRGYYNKERQLGVRVDTYYWYFVFAGWLPLYLITYILPRWA